MCLAYVPCTESLASIVFYCFRLFLGAKKCNGQKCNYPYRMKGGAVSLPPLIGSLNPPLLSLCLPVWNWTPFRKRSLADTHLNNRNEQGVKEIGTSLCWMVYTNSTRVWHPGLPPCNPSFYLACHNQNSG